MSLAPSIETIPSCSFNAGLPGSPVPWIDEKSAALEDSLRQTGHCGLNRVRVTVADGWIVLRGQVPSYYVKQLAQEAVRPLSLGMRIRNEIHVSN